MLWGMLGLPLHMVLGQSREHRDLCRLRDGAGVLAIHCCESYLRLQSMSKDQNRPVCLVIAASTLNDRYRRTRLFYA